MRLSHRDYDLLLKLLPELYATSDFESFPEVGISLLQRLIPAERFSYNELSVIKQTALVLGSPKVVREEELLESFREHFGSHPVIKHMLQTGQLGVGDISDFWTTRQFLQTGLYHDYYRKIGVKHQVSVYLENSPLLQIAFACNRGRQGFSKRDKQILHCLLPHLRRTYRNGRLIYEARQEANLLASTLADSGHGVITIRRDLRVLWMTAQARAWLMAYFPDARLSMRSLPGAIQLWLREQIENGRTMRALVLARGDNQLIVRFRRNAEGRCWLVLREQWLRVTPKLSAQICLSPREVDVLNWLLAGKSNLEIASILFISPRTVEKHVERVLTKLDVENRAAILGRVQDLMGLG